MKKSVYLILGFIALMCCKSFSEETPVFNLNSWEAFAFDNTLDDSISTTSCTSNQSCAKYYNDDLDLTGVGKCCAKFDAYTTGHKAS